MDRDSSEAILRRLADSLEKSSTTMSESLRDLKKEIAELKEKRYQPYFTSMGLFIVVTLAVTGYVYSLESRITVAMFNLQKEIAASRADILVSSERIDIHAERAQARQKYAMERERALRDSIAANKAQASTIGRELIDHMKPPHMMSE